MSRTFTGMTFNIIPHCIKRTTLQWPQNVRVGVSNHQPHGCLPNRWFGRRSKTTSKLRVNGLCVWGIHRGPMNSPDKWPVTQKMFPFDDVVMISKQQRMQLQYTVNNSQYKQLGTKSIDFSTIQMFNCIICKIQSAASYPDGSFVIMAWICNLISFPRV